MNGALSCHFGWPTPTDCAAFETDLRIHSSVFGTYFMAVGFSQGYFGIQDNGPGNTSILFSVWDGNSNDPNGTPKNEQARIHNSGTAFKIQRFGGEGCGLQAFAHFDFEKAIGETLRFQVTSSKLDDEWSIFTAWFQASPSSLPRMIASYRSRMQGRMLNGFYSFIEDFRKKQARMRSAIFNPRFSEKWEPLQKITRGRFTREGAPDDQTTMGEAWSDGFMLRTAGEMIVSKKRNVVHGEIVEL